MTGHALPSPADVEIQATESSTTQHERIYVRHKRKIKRSVRDAAPRMQGEGEGCGTTGAGIPQHLAKPRPAGVFVDSPPPAPKANRQFPRMFASENRANPCTKATNQGTVPKGCCQRVGFPCPHHRRHGRGCRWREVRTVFLANGTDFMPMAGRQQSLTYRAQVRMCRSLALLSFPGNGIMRWRTSCRSRKRLREKRT